MDSVKHPFARPSRPMTRSQSMSRLLLTLALCTSFASCAVRRELTIRSNPPGALVRVDDELVGVTPLTFRFQDYGSRLVTFYKDDFRTRSTRIRLRAPWYLRFPADFVSELLLPFGWRDRREITLDLSPESGTVAPPDFQLVRARAERLRRAGPEGPGPLTIETVDLKPITSPNSSGSRTTDERRP